MTERAREAERERARERGRERGVSRDEMDVWGRRGRVTGGGSGSCTTILVAVAAGPAQRCACRHRYCTSGRVWFAHCNTVYMTLTVWVFTTNTTRPLSRDVSPPRPPNYSRTQPPHPYGKVRLVTIDAFLGPTRQFGLCNFRNWAPKVRLALLNFGCR